MAMVLQVRRGTTAQHENFTGMPGEVTFDTDAKTLRVHDGATLGGFALARGDVATGAAFDINSVSDEFWGDLFARMTPPAMTVISSTPMPLYNGARIEYTFDTPRTPIMARVALVCQNAAAGYNVGDQVSAFGIGANCAPMVNIYSDPDGVRVVLFVGGGAFWVCDKTTGARTDVINDDWQIVFRLYC